MVVRLGGNFNPSKAKWRSNRRAIHRPESRIKRGFSTASTFNYTNTLQKLYGVSPDHITHIHNQVVGIESDLVLGHGVNPKTIASLNADADLEDQDTRVTQANECIDGYFSTTYKPTDLVISAHQAFFHSLSDIKRICVLGHSLSGVDWPYFELIAENTKVRGPQWTVSYHDESKIQGMMDAFFEFGIPAAKITYAHITDIHPEP